MNLTLMSDKPVDVILNDISVDPEDSLAVLERIMPLLKQNGRVLQVLKLSKTSQLDSHLDRIRKLGLTVQHILQHQKREIYVIAVRMETMRS